MIPLANCGFVRVTLVQVPAAATPSITANNDINPRSVLAAAECLTFLMRQRNSDTDKYIGVVLDFWTGEKQTVYFGNNVTSGESDCKRKPPN
jgi:hypothetical protein